MSDMNDGCERCGKLVRQRGDHTCPPCAEFLGRHVSQPFWGDFANHPDAKLRRIPYERMSIKERPDGSAQVAA